MHFLRNDNGSAERKVTKAIKMAQPASGRMTDKATLLLSLHSKKG